jgi:hypothetical protein
MTLFGYQCGNVNVFVVASGVAITFTLVVTITLVDGINKVRILFPNTFQAWLFTLVQ